jgi:hypothetical protein
MDNKKKTIITLWVGTTVFLALFFFLPSKADNYFLSLRVLNNEKEAVKSQAAEQANPLRFFRSAKDDARMLKMLEDRANNDGRWLVVFTGLVVFALNTMACFLYIFDMKPVFIALWMLGYLLAACGVVLQSYISVSP